MHIPSGESSGLDILSFDRALTEYETAMSGSPWLYVPPSYEDYRYLLGTKGSRPLICIGINPSTAEPGNLDNTLKSVERTAAFNGFASWIMFNVYAQRATRPEDMDKTLNETLHRENMAAFEYALSLNRETEPVIWAAWGTIVEKRDYLKDCLRDMVETGKRFSARWVCAGNISKAGHPHHPLYLKKNEPVRPFDMETYLTEL